MSPRRVKVGRYTAPMPRSFNIGGPCQADINYRLPPERRLAGARALIDRCLERLNRLA